MADTTIFGLAEELTTPGPNDLVGIWDLATSKYKKIKQSNLIGLTITGGGTLALGGFTLTVPSSGVAAIVSSGSWTPDLSFGGANVGLTYGSRVGSYYRIGNVVFIVGTLTLTAKGSSTGQAAVSGLPFTAVSTTNLIAPVVTFWGLFSVAQVTVIGQISPSSAAISLVGATAAATTPLALTETAFSATSILRFQGVYFT